MLHKWKYFVWVSSKDPDPIENSLRYYFFDLKNRNKLYECWVFYKILDLLTDIFDSKLSEVDSKGVATFRSSDNSMEVTYQGIYKTGWFDHEEPVNDIPDIVIEFNKINIIILDAKNSIMPPGNRYHYRRQMESYINSLGVNKTNFGVLIFSYGREPHWKQISRLVENREGEQKILWLTLSPSSKTDVQVSNQHSIDKIAQIIRACDSNLQ